MDEKDIKASLKDARGSIRDKDFKAALRKCKNVLKIDKNNYNALIFVGVCAQELEQMEQAVMAYRKAIEISPDQPLAWQGLAAFYEKQPEKNRKELIEIYNSLIELQTTPQKKVELLVKLSKAYFSDSFLDESVDILRKGIDVSTGVQDLECLLWKSGCEMFRLFPNSYSAHWNIYEVALKGILHSATDPAIIMEYSKEYIQLLKRMNRFEDAKCTVENLLKNNPDDEFCREQLFILYVESTFEGKYLNVDDIETMCDNFNPKQLTRSFAEMALGAVKFRQGDWLAGKEHLISGLNLAPSYIRGWLLLCRTLRKMNNWVLIQQVASRGLKIMQSEPESSLKCLGFQLQMYYITSLLESGNTDVNITLCLESYTESKSAMVELPELLYFQGYFLLKLDRKHDALMILEWLRKIDGNHWALGLEGLLESHEGKLDKAEQVFTEALKVDTENGTLLAELGKILWKLEKYDDAKDLFVRVVKSDRWNYEAFIMLGRYYRDVANDLTRAQKCYSQAFNLNENDEIGVMLSELYNKTGDENANLKLLLHVTTNSVTGSCKWAWIRLGLCYLKQNNTEHAIRAFQSTLRADPLDGHCWECLADAYLQRGSYDAALKSFKRASEINSASIYSLYQMASIRIVLGEHAEAVGCFERVLGMAPSYVPALKGLAEAYLAMAKNHMAKCLHERAESDCQNAINSLARALECGNEISCLWKLLGDACILPSSSGSKPMCFTMPVKFLQDQPGEYVGRMQLLKMSTICYQRAVSILPSCSGYWHDLGLSLYYQACQCVDDLLRKDAIKMATLCLKKAISLNAYSSEHWNALGVISAFSVLKDYEMAQHAFVRSIQVEPNNVIAWANLGVLYLINENEELAHKALSEAQSLEPSYVNCWVSLALIAEKVGHADTMDLFMHSTTLGNHMEALIAYGYWVCKTLLDVGNRGTELFKYRIEEMAAIPRSLDCLTHYSDNYVENACAFNMLGLILERQKLYNGAVKSFKRSLVLLETNAGSNDFLDMVRENLARTYIQCEMFEEAARHLSAIKEPGFFSQCNLATVLAKVNRLQDSYNAFESAVSWLANTDEEKSHALISMAALAYPLEGSESSKTLLFQSTQQSVVCPQALLALGAIGVLDKDITLTTAVMDELSKWSSVRQYAKSIALLQLGVAAIKDEIGKSKLIISKVIHVNPNYGELWELLAFVLLKINEPNSAIVHCTRVAAREELSLNVKILEGVAALAIGNVRQAVLIAQHVLHCFPEKVQSWSLMLAALYGNYVLESNLSALRSLNAMVSFVQAKFLAGKGVAPLKWWMGCYRIIISWQTKQAEKLNMLIGEVPNVTGDPRKESVCKVLECVMSSQPRDIQQFENASRVAINLDSNFTLGYKVLVDENFCNGNFEIALGILEKWEMSSRNEIHNSVIPLIYKAFIYIKQAQNNPEFQKGLVENARKILQQPVLKKLPVTYYLMSVMNVLNENISAAKCNVVKLLRFPYRRELHDMFVHAARLLFTTFEQTTESDFKLAQSTRERLQELKLHEVTELYSHFNCKVAVDFGTDDEIK